MRVYFASGFGFSWATKDYMALCVKKMELADLTVVNPWDLTSQAEIELAVRMGHEVAIRQQIGRRNAMAIDSCDILIANLDGQEVDSGVAWEIGYAYGKGKPCLAWRSDFRASGELGGRVNLQVAYGVVGNIEQTLEAVIQRILNECG